MSDETITRPSTPREPGSPTLGEGEGEGEPAPTKCREREAGSATRTLARHERPDVVDAPGIEHVSGLQPSATCRPDTEVHLARERLDAMAVAVDSDPDASSHRPPREAAVHVEMPGRSVDLHRRPGGRRLGKQLVEIDGVALGMRRRSVG